MGIWTYCLRFWYNERKKRDTIPHVDALSRQEFSNEKVENYKNPEDKIIRKVETEILPLNRFWIETKHDPAFRKILEIIKGNILSSC